MVNDITLETPPLFIFQLSSVGAVSSGRAVVGFQMCVGGRRFFFLFGEYWAL